MPDTFLQSFVAKRSVLARVSPEMVLMKGDGQWWMDTRISQISGTFIEKLYGFIFTVVASIIR